MELDGSGHLTSEAKQKDAVRDAWVRSQGIQVLRFGGWQVEFEAQKVLAVIDRALQERCAK